MSAAAVISPMLITFLGMDPYMAVGIALSSDVLASAISAYTYAKNKNIDIKKRSDHDAYRNAVSTVIVDGNTVAGVKGTELINEDGSINFDVKAGTRWKTFSSICRGSRGQLQTGDQG